MTTDLLTREELGRRQGSVWDYVSPSRLSLWAKCPLAFKLKYIDGVKVPTSPSMFVGQRVHAGLETYYRHRQLGVTLDGPTVIGQLQSTWEEAVAKEGMQFDSADHEQKLWRQTADLVTAYVDQAPADEAKPLAVEVAMEVPLVDPESGEDLGIPLVGIVDLVLQSDSGPTIIDHKTAARGGELLEISHEIQLTSYAYAFRQATGDEEGGLEIRRLIKTKKTQITTHPFRARTADHFRRLFALVRAYLDDVESQRFVYRPGWSSCQMCDFRETHCRAWCG